VVRQSLLLGLALSVAPCLTGCPASSTSKELTEKDTKSTAPVEGHAHEHGPHDGEIVELEPNHGEVCLEKDRKATLYILDGAIKNAVPMADTTAVLKLKDGTSVALKAMPLEGETDGKSSRYQSEGPLPEAIKDVHDIAGEVIVTTAGKETKGEVGHAH
jgi:hypothetical protein